MVWSNGRQFKYSKFKNVSSELNCHIQDTIWHFLPVRQIFVRLCGSFSDCQTKCLLTFLQFREACWSDTFTTEWLSMWHVLCYYFIDRPDGVAPSKVKSDGNLSASDLQLSSSTLASTAGSTSLDSNMSTASTRSLVCKYSVNQCRVKQIIVQLFGENMSSDQLYTYQLSLICRDNLSCTVKWKYTLHNKRKYILHNKRKYTLHIKHFTLKESIHLTINESIHFTLKESMHFTLEESVHLVQ